MSNGLSHSGAYGLVIEKLEARDGIGRSSANVTTRATCFRESTNIRSVPEQKIGQLFTVHIQPGRNTGSVPCHLGVMFSGSIRVQIGRNLNVHDRITSMQEQTEREWLVIDTVQIQTGGTDYKIEHVETRQEFNGDESQVYSTLTFSLNFKRMR